MFENQKKGYDYGLSIFPLLVLVPKIGEIGLIVVKIKK